MNNAFFIGIIESRADPLKLNRYQVRVFGVHTESLTDIPTASLPWAIAITDSAALSGIGKSTSYVEGSMVFVFFQDGESKQQPIILGSAHGIPMSKTTLGTTNTTQDETIEIIKNTSDQKVTSSVKESTSGNLVDSSGTPVVDSSGSPVKSGTIDSRQLLKDALGKKESSNNYAAVNQLNYLGKYQFGAAMLTDLGYVVKGSKNKDLNNPSAWTGKDGITSKEVFLKSHAVQESAMDAELNLNESRLKRMGVIDSTTTEQEKSGYLATSHLLGTGGARDMKKGIVKSDANGVTGNTYYKLGYSAVAGAEPTVLPQSTVAENPSRETSVVPDVGVTTKKSNIILNGVGFSDPSGKYPTYIKEQDTNRLARNQNIDKTIVPQKEETEDKNVYIANGQGTWDQSPTPYNATYPFNQVLETESGHIMEFDDSPNNERIHLYHTSGTFQEIDRNGTLVRKIIGDSYEIVERNGYVHIKGTVNITVEGNANIAVGNNCELDIAGSLTANIGGSASWSVGGDWKVKTGGVEHHSNAGGYATDASTVNFNSGVSTAGVLPSPTRSAAGIPEFGHLSIEPRGFEELSDFESDDMTPAESTEHQKVLADKGLVDTNPVKATEGESEIVTPTNQPDKVVSCDAFKSGAININDYISTNFRLRDLTLGKSIPVSQSGISDAELACNLKKLAVNVLEAIKQKYPDMIITSGLRPMGSNPRSQHPLGQAADLQFTTKKSSDYINIAKDILSFATVDQCILEYRTNKRVNGQPTTWIHVSFSDKGNRNQVFTMNNDLRVSNFGELKIIT
jgi:hypothetical protein